jgi:uncharacterized RDD family membrane protein YckC
VEATVGWSGRSAPGGAGTVVTPEAVVVELRTASIASRGLARALDLGVALLAVNIVSLPFAIIGPTVAGIVSVFLGVFVIFGYPAVLEAVWRGRTLGKAAFGLRVVTAEGGPIGARQAIVRAVLLPIDLVAGAVSVLLSPRDRRVGDVLAGTIVRHERRDDRPLVPIWFGAPWGLEAYAASLDPSGVRPEELLAARTYLVRFRHLTPAARRQVGEALAAPIARRLAHPVPPGLPPELYLHSLLAARQAADNGVPVTVPARPTWSPLPPAWGPPAPGLSPGGRSLVP